MGRVDRLWELESKISGLEYTVEYLEADNQRLSAEVGWLRDALQDCLSSMIVLSDETFEMFKDRKDTDTIYSWEAGRYRAMKKAADKAKAALKGGDNEG